MSELGDDYPVKMQEKVPGQPILMFYVEGDKKWNDTGVLLVGRGAPKADNRQALLGNVITTFPADYPDDNTGMRQRPDLDFKERREYNRLVWERAKKLIDEDRLTVGSLRDEVFDGAEVNLVLSGREDAREEDVFYNFMRSKLKHSPVSSDVEREAVVKDISEAFGGHDCGVCERCSRYNELISQV